MENKIIRRKWPQLSIQGSDTSLMLFLFCKTIGTVPVHGPLRGPMRLRSMPGVRPCRTVLQSEGAAQHHRQRQWPASVILFDPV
jgi:hypothetical protein